ncbi:MAG: mucoidy inhibitor MuiA family protein [bacterium]|nr:mucoidy inhibitor MuiA family protein [bacterium]
MKYSSLRPSSSCVALCIALAAICYTGPNRQGPQAAPTAHPFAVEAVQLYSDQALVTRTGKAELKAGVNRVVIEDLPGKLIVDSVRVTLLDAQGRRLRASGNGLRIQGIEVESDHREVFLSAEAEQAETRLKAAESRLRRLSDRYGALQREEANLKKIKVGSRPKPTDADGNRRPEQINPAAWRSTLDFIQSALKKNHERSRSMLDEIDSAREELSVALFVAGKYRSARSLEKKRVRVEIKNEAGRAGRYQFQLSYRIPGAAWYPIYNARVEGEGDTARVRLIAYALLRNETGEDWRRARLSFSAADPRESGRLPKLTSWRIESQLIADSSISGSGSGVSDRRPRRESAKSDESYGDFASDSIEEEAEEPAPQQVAERQRNIPLQSREQRQQQQLNKQAARSKDYIQSNAIAIKDKRAGKKSVRTQQVLGEFETNIVRRDQAWQRQDYANALRYSELVIGNIEKIDTRFQKHFIDEQRKSERLKRRALEMQENRALIGKLISPVASARGYDHNYRARNPETVLSNGAFRKVYLYEKQLSADLLYESAAVQPADRGGRSSQFAFLTGRVKYAEETPLLSGPISVFHNKDYVGDSVLKDVSKKEPFTVHLGANEDIQISRTADRFRETTGILSKSYVYKNKITIEVKNRKRTAVTLDLFDRIPVSQDERVQITDLNLRPAPAARKQDEGLLRFRINLRPGQTETIVIEYKLSHPEGVLPRFRGAGGPRW